MKKVVRLEYDKNKFIDVEVPRDDSDGGLGGLEQALDIGRDTLDRSVSVLVSFLNAMSDKIQQGLHRTDVGEVSVTVGASFGVKGNLILASSTSEANLSVTITFKGED